MNILGDERICQAHNNPIHALDEIIFVNQLVIEIFGLNTSKADAKII